MTMRTRRQIEAWRIGASAAAVRAAQTRSGKAPAPALRPATRVIVGGIVREASR